MMTPKCVFFNFEAFQNSKLEILTHKVCTNIPNPKKYQNLNYFSGFNEINWPEYLDR